MEVNISIFSILSRSFSPHSTKLLTYELWHVMLSMTGYGVPGFQGFKQRLLFPAAFKDKRTAGVKTAAGRGVDGTGDITGKNDAFALVPDLRHWNS